MSRSDVEVDVATYKAQLDQLSESLRSGENPAGVRASLPRAWMIQTEQSRMVVPTDWLVSHLLEAERDPAKSKDALREVQRRLSAMREAATELQAKSDGDGTKSARSRLENILHRREFASANGPSEMELLQARIARWIEERILWLLSLFHIGRTAGNAVTWAVVAAAFAALCYWAWRNLSFSRRSQAPGEPRAVDETREWARDAFNAAERGDYREAVHCAYWMTIVHLEGLGLLKRDHARTPRESLRLLDPHPRERQLLLEFTRSFELIWYGYRPASLADWANARAHLEKMGCLTSSTAATANS